MYTGPGERVDAVAVRALTHGDPCVIGGLVGFAAKNEGLGRYDDPSDAGVRDIAIGEVFQLFLTGVHELPLTGGVAAGAVGGLLYIDPDDDSVALAADVATGDLPLGVIQEIDASRAPDVARVNLNTWQAFLPTPA